MNETRFAPADAPDYAPPSAMRNNRPNIDGGDRLLSFAGGAALAGWGLRRGGLAGLGALALGAALFARGGTRQDPVKHLLSGRPAAKATAKALGWSSAALANRAVTINRPREEAYRAWRDFSTLATVLENIESIENLGPKRSRWTAKAPGGGEVEWISEIVDEEEGRRIAWRSVEDSKIKTAGRIEFADALAGRACEVRATIAYEPPAGELGRIVATLFQKEPVLQAKRDLRRFKQFLETGEIATASAPAAAPRAT